MFRFATRYFNLLKASFVINKEKNDQWQAVPLKPRTLYALGFTAVLLPFIIQVVNGNFAVELWLIFSLFMVFIFSPLNTWLIDIMIKKYSHKEE